MRVLLLLLVLTSCGPELPRTACGLIVQDDTGLLQESQVPPSVDAAIAHGLVTCNKLANQLLHVKVAKTWPDPRTPERNLSGQMFCAWEHTYSPQGRIDVGNPFPGLFANSSFIHELVHLNDCPAVNFDHIDWPTAEIQAAQKEAALVETSNK